MQSRFDEASARAGVAEGAALCQRWRGLQGRSFLNRDRAKNRSRKKGRSACASRGTRNGLIVHSRIDGLIGWGANLHSTHIGIALLGRAILVCIRFASLLLYSTEAWNLAHTLTAQMSKSIFVLGRLAEARACAVAAFAEVVRSSGLLMALERLPRHAGPFLPWHQEDWACWLHGYQSAQHCPNPMKRSPGALLQLSEHFSCKSSDLDPLQCLSLACRG